MGTFKGDVNARRIDRAYQYIGKPWFPVNQQVVKRITGGLSDGAYEQDITPLLAELTSDFSLFAFVVRELTVGAAKAKNTQPPPSSNPLELIRSAGLRTLRDIITPSRLPSTHSLHWSEPFQLERLRETAVAASTTSLLCDKRGLDPELGFIRGLMRQVGITLIAWNYPSVYQRALEGHSSDQDLGERLSAELGFSPDLLGEMIFNPKQAGEDEANTAKDEQWAAYDELCAIGELVTYAEHPTRHPKALTEWDRARQVLYESLGDSALDEIREHAINRSSAYTQSIPEVFNTLDTFDPERQIRRHRRIRRATSQMHFSSCSEDVRAALISFYADLPDDHVDKEMIGRLLKDVVPEAGFTGGCVFVVEEGTTSLKPKTLIGKVQMRPIASTPLDPSDPALSAFASTEPIVKNGAAHDKTQLAGIYGSIGSSRKVGVLYLETPHASPSSPSEATIGTFHVLKQALADALLLE